MPSSHAAFGGGLFLGVAIPLIGFLIDKYREGNTRERHHRSTWSQDKSRNEEVGNGEGRTPTCVVCLFDPVEVMLEPCGHISLCCGCSEELLR